MLKQPIRNFRTSKTTPPRFCDVVVDGENVYLELKISSVRVVTIPWEDFKYQVQAAIATDGKKLPQAAP